jgi:hypothetical protein
MLYSLLAHFHLRGRAARITVHCSDGGNEILLSISKYDFNWQPIYALAPPKLIPSGTRVVLAMTWDNSAQNPANPDPNKTAFWGDHIWEVMNVGWFRFRADDDDDRRKAALESAGRQLVDASKDKHTSAAHQVRDISTHRNKAKTGRHRFDRTRILMGQVRHDEQISLRRIHPPMAAFSVSRDG